MGCRTLTPPGLFLPLTHWSSPHLHSPKHPNTKFGYPSGLIGSIVVLSAVNTTALLPTEWVAYKWHSPSLREAPSYTRTILHSFNTRNFQQSSPIKGQLFYTKCGQTIKIRVLSGYLSGLTPTVPEGCAWKLGRRRGQPSTSNFHLLMQLLYWVTMTLLEGNCIVMIPAGKLYDR